MECKSESDEQMKVLVGVEELRQEVKSLKNTVSSMPSVTKAPTAAECPGNPVKGPRDVIDPPEQYLVFLAQFWPQPTYTKFLRC